MLSSRLKETLKTKPQPHVHLAYGWDHVVPNLSQYTPRYVEMGIIAGYPVNVPNRYHFNLPYLDNWFPPLESMVPISVVDKATKNTFQRSLPAAYMFHLHWMSHRAELAKRGSTEQQKYSSYFYQVLDAFAEEIEKNEDMSGWRSVVLTPLLVREYHSLDSFAPSSIQSCLKGQILHRGSLTEWHWANFYFKYDVIHPKNSRTWIWIKANSPWPMAEPQVLPDTGRCDPSYTV